MANEVRFCFYVILAAFCLSSAFSRIATAQIFPQTCQPSNFPGFGAFDSGDPIPGVGWAAWAYFMNLSWSSAQMNEPGFYDGPGSISAAASVPSGSWVGELGIYSNGNFPPAATATGGGGDPNASDYAFAAAQFHQGNYAGSIPLFDQIAKNPNSPYRAAAAYSAARAALNDGDYANGFNRIARIFADPTMQSFDGPAYDLTGTLAGDRDDVQMLAARL